MELREGFPYFKGNFLDQKRYTKLLADPYKAFNQMLITYCLSIGQTLIAANLFLNTEATCAYFKENGWTSEDMAQGWFQDYEGKYLYGKNATNNGLINTNGVWIKNDLVYIAHYDEGGYIEGPHISLIANYYDLKE